MIMYAVINQPGIRIDFIEFRMKNGLTIVADWDESEWSDYCQSNSGETFAKMKGVYFNGEYANGKLEMFKSTLTCINEIAFCSQNNKEISSEKISLLKLTIADYEKIYQIPEKKLETGRYL